jgi:3-isopropylmalate/(R)-2-methylmalate dehydratase small subunit
MEAFRTLRSRTAVLPMTNIDTDQIIPARFLTTTTRTGLGAHLFADWRYDAQGAPRADFALNRPETHGCRILVAGRNLGCGSSREHAAWALLDYGFRAVISTEIADIFRSNCLKNGLLPIVVDEATSQALLQSPGMEVNVDLDSRTLQLESGARVTFDIDAFARFCLLNGVDQLGFLLGRTSDIEAYERAHASN